MSETRDSSYSRDLLRRFMCVGGGTHFPVKPKAENPEHRRQDNVELSLGLSLNGRFGVEPQRVVANDGNNNKKLSRASSVVDFVNFPADVDLSLYSPLTRTCSLPTETGAEWRRRKELQTLRRSEAKRKRVEKMKNVRLVKGKSGDGIESWGADLKQSPSSPPPRLPPRPPLQFSSQDSLEGSGGSSGFSDFESQPLTGMDTGMDTDTEMKGKTDEHFVPNQISSTIASGFNKSKKVDAPIEPSFEKSSQLVNTGCRNDKTSQTVPTQMPHVSTRCGPDGKKTEGFLYRYGKGEEVRIVCVCHGSFLTPAEFVKHGGGSDVEHPLRHIIVNSSSFS